MSNQQTKHSFCCVCCVRLTLMALPLEPADTIALTLFVCSKAFFTSLPQLHENKTTNKQHERRNRTSELRVLLSVCATDASVALLSTPLTSPSNVSLTVRPGVRSSFPARARLMMLLTSVFA